MACRTESVDAPRQQGARMRHTVEYDEEAQRSGSEGPVPGRVGSRGEADAPSDREGRPSTAQAYWRYAEPGAGSPTKGWRCRPSRRRRSPTGLPFLLRQAIPGLRRAGSALAWAGYLPAPTTLPP